MGPFRVYGALQSVWGPSECMGPLTHVAAHFFGLPLYPWQGYRPDNQRFFRQAQEGFLQNVQKGPEAQPATHSIGLREVCSPSPGVKQLWREDYSPLSNAQVKNKWRYASVTQYAFMACTGKYLASTHNTQFIPSFYRISFQSLSFVHSITPSLIFLTLEQRLSTYRS